MAQRRTNYSQMYKRNTKPSEGDSVVTNEEPKEIDEEITESVDELPETMPDNLIMHYRKTTTAKVRIRKGPGPNYESTGECVEDREIAVREEQNGFGRLEDTNGNTIGWVNLQYFKEIKMG